MAHTSPPVLFFYFNHGWRACWIFNLTAIHFRFSCLWFSNLIYTMLLHKSLMSKRRLRVWLQEWFIWHVYIVIIAFCANKMCKFFVKIYLFHWHRMPHHSVHVLCELFSYIYQDPKSIIRKWKRKLRICFLYRLSNWQQQVSKYLLRITNS